MKTFRYWKRSTLLIVVLVGITACEKPAEATKQQDNNPAVSLTVYKNAQCKCCGRWVSHVQGAGLLATAINSNDMNAVKARYGIGPRVQSCHTAIDRDTGYVFEGHIPVSVMQRFLKEKPAGAKGLSVPGMPVGSPGMEMGNRRDAYDVLLLMKDGSVSVYAHIDGKN